MPYLEVSVSGSVKDAQRDTNPAAEFSLAFTDAQANEYDGAKRLTVAAGTTREVDLCLSDLRIIGIEIITGTSLRLRFRAASTQTTDLTMRRFFYAELTGIEQIKLVNEGTEDVVVRLFLVGIATP